MNDDLKTRLMALGLTDAEISNLEKEGAKDETGMAMLSAEDIKSITGCGTVTARQVANSFKPEPAPMPTMTTSPSLDMLPEVPDDTTFLESLKVGGILKISTTDVISATRAAIASDLGLYELPSILMERMEAFAEEQSEPVGEDFYTLRKMIASRRYADVLSAIGVDGNFVSETRKRRVLKRLHDQLWPALKGFHLSLKGWMENWQSTMANPGMMMTMFVAAQTGQTMPGGMTTPPETDTLRDEAESVINEINKVFAGTGIPVARALAYDATRIKGILDNPSLPAAVGSATRDQMIKSLGVDVGPDYVRLEKNVVRFALSVMQLPTISAGNEELAYLGSLVMLGNSIAWDKLGRNIPTLINRKSAGHDDLDEEETPVGAGFHGGR